MKFICPLIVVSDIDNSRHFYESILHQNVKFDFGENITFHGDFAIHQKAHFSDLLEKEISYGGNNFELYFEHDDLEEMVVSLKQSSVVFIHEIKEQPWRQRVIRFYDPDNHIIEIGESMEYVSYRLKHEGFSIQKIEEITNLPQRFIEQSIAKYEQKIK